MGKASTIAQFVPPAYVICIYTQNWQDEADVYKCREVLRELGFTRKIPYKSDEMTLAGKRGSIYYA